jgi:hypothetical protein
MLRNLESPADLVFIASSLNRYSMPVTRSRTYLNDIGLEDSNNTTGFLFGDEDSASAETRTTPTNNPDSFPALLRQQGYGTLVSSPNTFCLLFRLVSFFLAPGTAEFLRLVEIVSTWFAAAVRSWCGRPVSDRRATAFTTRFFC